MKTLVAITALAIASSAQAVPVVIDFEDTLPTYFNLASYQEDGFTLTSNTPDSTLIDDNNTVRQNIGIFSGGSNSQSIFWGANGETSTLSLVNDGGLQFSLLSFDASSLYNTAGVLSLSGTKIGGGGVVTQNLVLTSALTNYAISGFDNIVDLQISFDGSTDFAPYDLDNIQLDVVPIPAAIWLFVSALGVTGLWRKRRPSY